MKLFERFQNLSVLKNLITPVNNAFRNPRIVSPSPLIAGQIVYTMPTAPVTKTTSVTLTAAEVLGGIILANQGGGAAATYTMPTGTLLEAEINKLNPGFIVGDCFDFTIVNISTVAAEDVTVAGGVDTTAVGNMTIASNAAVADQAWGTFRFRKTGAHAFSFYRIG
jgi:hypothetical protein